MLGFGFSLGDFIAGINVLIDVAHSLNDTYGAQADYEELGRELKSLRDGLDSIERLSLDPTQAAETTAVKAAVNNCYACVDTFVQRNNKFKGLESTPGHKWSLKRLKKCGRGVQWAIWKKDDVAKFRTELGMHSEAIHMLLATLQL